MPLASPSRMRPPSVEEYFRRDEEDRTTFLALRHAAMTGRDFTGIRWIRYRCLPIFAEPTNIPKVERRIAQ